MNLSPPKDADEWTMALWRVAKKYKGTDTTANRPTNGLEDADWYFDTTLGKPIWFYNSGWVDATGASV